MHRPSSVEAIPTGCLYPGAPHERKHVAMDCLMAVLGKWAGSDGAASGVIVPTPDGNTQQFQPLCANFYSQGTVQVNHRPENFTGAWR
eukprot:scaffold16886_cov37-Prasinocladus_malaysianus.AAC.1